MSSATAVHAQRLRKTKAQLIEELEALDQQVAVSGDTDDLLRDVINCIPEGCSYFDADNRLVMCNDAYKEIYGYSDADVAPGASYDALIRTDAEHGDVHASSDYLQRRVRHRKRASGSFEFQMKDGRSIRIRDRKTASGGIVSIQTDITEHTAAEEKMRFSRQRLRDMIDSAPDAIVSVDMAGKVLTWNRRAARMFGYTAKEIAGKSLVGLMPERFRDGHSAGLARANTGGKNRMFGAMMELVGLRKNGEEFPIELTLSSTMREDKRIHTGIIRDVSALSQAKKALRDSEQLYQTIAANVPGVVYQRVRRPDGAIEFPYVSPGLRETHGLSPTAVMRNPDLWINATHPDDRAQLDASNAASIASLSTWSLEYRIITPGGAVRWMRGTSHVRHGDDGNVFSDGIVLDITEQRLAQQQLEDVARFPSENPNPVLRVEPDGSVLYANDASYQINGVLVGRRKNKLTRKLTRVVEQVVANGERQVAEFAVTGWVVSFTVTPVAGETYINLYGRNVTEEYHAKQEMKAAREASAASATLLRDAIDNISDGFVVYDAKDRLVTCNQIWRDFYGYTDDEAQPGARYHDLVRLDLAKGAISTDADLSETYETMRVAFRKVKEGAFETKLVDGRWILIHERTTTDGGRVGIQTDITNLKRTQEALGESERRYALAVEGASDGLWDWNVATGEIYVSPHAKEILGIEIDGDIVMAAQWNARVHPDDLMELVDREKTHLGGGSELFTNEYRIRNADGAYRWVLDRGACLRDDMGRPYRMAGSLSDITDRKRGELFLRSVVDAMPVALNIRDAAGRYVLTNNLLAAYYGVDPKDTVGKLPHEVYPDAETDEREENEFRQVVATGQPIIDSEYNYGDDGHGNAAEHWLTTRLPIHDAAGQLQYVLTLAHDITELKRAEEALRQNNEMLQAIVDAAPAMINAKDLDSRYTFINRYQADLYGVSTEKALGKTAGQLLTRRHGAATRRRDIQVIESGEAVPYFEDDHVDAYGVRRTLFATKVPLMGEGSHVRGVVTVALDITERKRAEQFLYSIVDSLPATLNIRDREGRYVLANKRLTDYYQIEPSEAVGKLPIELFGDNESNSISDREFSKVVESGEAIIDSEMAIMAVDGSDEVWLVSRQPLHDSAGRLQHVLSLGIDITQLKLAQRALREANQRVTEQNRVLESLSDKLSKFLPPQLAASIFRGEQSVAIDSRRRKLTIFFSDIADFTAISDRLESEELTGLLNQYLTEMSRIGLEYGATIDKFVGDAIMMFFGDPDSRGAGNDAIACVEMAVAMQRRMAELKVEWRDRGIEHPFELRIGINTGYCTVGNFGSEDRMDYTIIGNAVNLASRLQSRAEVGGILMANETYSLVKKMVHTDEDETITVKGIHEPVRTFRVSGLYDELAARGRIIRHDGDGLSLLIDRDKLSEAGRTEAIAALKAAVSQLKG
jgi:adenylate cyclase